MIQLRQLIAGVVMMMALLTAASGPVRVFVLPVDNEIGSVTWQHVRSGLARAASDNADMLVLRLNTYGGALDAADSIRTALLRCPLPTVAFIDNNAASAGALIALACDSVYMTPSASMGAATVVNGSDGAAMPDKYQSYMRAMMRATAESHGKSTDSAGAGQWRRDPLVAEAMVDHRVVVPGLVDSTCVLTMTASEAVKWHYADGVAPDLAAVMADLGVTDYTVVSYSRELTDTLTGWLNSPALKALLISLILLGIYFELQMPGSGLPAAASLTAAVIYFLPAFIDGDMSPWVPILFAAGVILLIFEILVIPGFGVAGIAGITAVAASLFWGLFDTLSSADPVSIGSLTLAPLWQTVVWFAVALAVTTGVCIWLASDRAPRWLRRTAELDRTLDTGDGYVGVDMAAGRHVGRTGTAVTDLRPVGKVDIDGERHDAISLDGFIERGEQVAVRRHEGAQLYVVRNDGLEAAPVN